MNVSRKLIGVGFFVLAFSAAAGVTVALISDGDEAAHAQASAKDPYYIYVFDEQGVANAVTTIETRVGFAIDIPAAPDSLKARVVAAVEGPPSAAGHGTRAIFDYYDAAYDLKPDVQPADYSGPRMQVTEFAGSLTPDERAVELPFPVAGFRAYRVSEADAPGAVGYYLVGKERSYAVNTWTMKAGQTVMQGDPPFQDAEILPMLEGLARS